MLIDLHTHTHPSSDDSLLSPTELVLKAKAAGLDGVCFTEHDWFWSKEAVDHLSKELDFLILPGVEMNTEDGHVLVFGTTDFIFGMHHTDFLRDYVLRNGGFMILSHPFRHRFYSDDDIEQKVEEVYRRPIFQRVDTIEVLNGRGKEKQNQFSVALGKKLGMKGVAGSDAHYPYDVGTAATKFQRNIRNVEELIQELKAGRYRPVDLRK